MMILLPYFCENVNKIITCVYRSLAGVFATKPWLVDEGRIDEDRRRKASQSQIRAEKYKPTCSSCGVFQEPQYRLVYTI